MNHRPVTSNRRNTAPQLFQVSANIHKVPPGRDDQVMTAFAQFIQRANRQRRQLVVFIEQGAIHVEDKSVTVFLVCKHAGFPSNNLYAP